LLFLLHRENGDFSILMKDIYFEFDFLKFLFKNNTCHIVLHRLYRVRRFVDLLVPDLESFMYLDEESFGGSIYPEMSC